MSKLKQVKTQLKNKDLWNAYQKRFRFGGLLLLSKMALDLNSELAPEALTTLEVKLLHSQTSEAFAKVFAELEAILGIKANWLELGRFMVFAYATTQYRKAVKKGLPNLYRDADIIKLNYDKRTHFHAWMSSLDESEADYNVIIQKVMRYGF